MTNENGPSGQSTNPVTNKKSPDVGAGPVASVSDGGVEGEAKQPKEHTGKQATMGGDDGGAVGNGNEKTAMPE